MAYRTYWDYSEEERANLSEAEVRMLLKYEYMESGVIEPTPPVYEPEKAPDLKPGSYYKVVLKFQTWGGDDIPVLFRNPVDARAFIEMEWDFLDYEYGEHCARTRTKQEIVSVELPDYDQVVEHQGALKDARKATERNEEKRRAYEKQLEVVSRASAGIWSDWHAQLARRDHLNDIKRTYQEYFELAGDSQIALRFLLKVPSFSHEDIAKAMPEYAELVYDMSGQKAAPDQELEDGPESTPIEY